METGFPIVMLTLPAVAAAIAVVLSSRRRSTAIVGLLASLLMTLLLWLAEPGTGLFADNSVIFFGRDIVLTPVVRAVFLFIYPAFGVLALMSWFRPLGRMVIPSGLAVLVPMAAALMVTPVAFGAVWLMIVAATLLPALYGGRYKAVPAAWRAFVLISLSILPLLMTASPPVSGWPRPWLGPLLMALIIFGSFPFHIWVNGLSRRTTPAALALALGLAQIVPVVFVLLLLDTVSAAKDATAFQAMVRWSAALTALFAAFQMGRSSEWTALVGGALLLDAGFLLTATIPTGVDGLMIAIPALINRYFSLLLISYATGRRARPAEPSFFGRFKWRLSSLLPAYALLSLIGLPLTPGFAGRWAQIMVVGQGAGFWPPFLLVASLMVAAGMGLRAISCSREGLGESARTLSDGEAIFNAALMCGFVVVGLFPHLLTNYVARMLGIL